MATIAEMIVKIGADSSGLKRELTAAQRQLQRAYGSDSLAVSSGAITLLAGVAAGMATIGAVAVKSAAEMEQNRIAFTTMLGSAKEAEKLLTDLATFAEKTPFEFTGLVNSSRQLLAYGYSAKEIIPMLTQIGDAASAFGATGDTIDRIVLAFGQMKAKGFISGEEMRQLASAGLPAWQMLADTIGTDIPTAMKLAEDKAIDAEAAMAGMLDQMGKKYGGMMQKQSGTVLGIISNIKDKAGTIMRAMGDDIVETFNLKQKLHGALKYLDEFADKIRSSGVRQAFLDMIPKEMEGAIVALAGAITLALIPALQALAIAATKAMLPLLPFIAIGAAITLGVYVTRELGDATSDASQRLRGMSNYMSDIQINAENTATAVDDLRKSLVKLRQEDKDRAADDLLGLPSSDAGDDEKKKKKVILDVGGGGGKDVVAEARRISDAIEKEWVQTTQTKMQQLDIWQAEQLKDLEKTKAANENYERDKLRVAAVYAERRLKIIQDESAASVAMQTKIKDGYDSLQKGISGAGLKGSSKVWADIANDQQNSMKSSKDFYEGIQRDFLTADNATKAEMLLNLQERGIQYKLTEQGNLDFTEARQADYLSILKDTREKENEIHRTAADVRAEIDAAYQTGSMERLQAALTEENAIRLNNYEAQRSMMDTYQEIFLAAHSTTAQLMANMYQGAFSGLSSALSDIFTRTKTVGQAFADLGKSMLKIVADYVAKWLAGRLMMAIFGKSALATDTAASTLAATKTAMAWSKAAAMVSLATFGANSIPAMAGIGATVAFSTGLGMIPQLAGGGITIGPTLAEIGEGPHKEVVMPLTRKAFEKVGLTSSGESGGDQYHITIQTYDGPSMHRMLMEHGGSVISSIKKQVKQFNVAEVGI